MVESTQTLIQQDQRYLIHPLHHPKDNEKPIVLVEGRGAMLKDADGIPAHGNQRSEWDAGCRFDFENPEYR